MNATIIIDAEDDQERRIKRQLEVDFTMSPYDPGNCSGPADICYPPEGGEIEVNSITFERDDKSSEVLTQEELEQFMEKYGEQVEAKCFEAGLDGRYDYHDFD